MCKCICSIFKNSLFWIITTALICFSFNLLINISIALLYLFLIERYEPTPFLFFKYFIILILFIYNWLILRKIVISWLFEWQFPIQKFSIYKERQNYITYLKLRLRNFIRAIEVILDINYKISKKDIEDIEFFLNIFEDEFNIYDKLYNIVNNNANNNELIRYTMSNCQIKYYDLLKAINRVLNENDTKQNLLDLVNNENNDIKMNKFSENQNFENKKNLAQLNMLLKELGQIIAKYDWDNYTYMSPAYLFNLLFNDTFGSLSLYHLQLKKKLEQYEVEENFTPKGKIHYMLIRNNSNTKNTNNENDLILDNSNKNDGTLMLFCLPNGGCYELIPKMKIDFYLNNGFSFLCWNYKGYGFTKGRANFSNCKTDALEIYDTIVNNPKYNFSKICVMGHSIGGIAACYIARNRHVDLLISDRNFCDMTRLVNNLYCGQCLSTLIKYLFIGKTDNINNFINFTNSIDKNNNNGIIKINEDKININRIIIYSPLDMLILNDSTVKSGVSRYIIKNYIIYKNNQNEIIKNKENFLDIVFNKNDKIRFINNFLRLLHCHYNKKNNNMLINNTKNDITLNLKNDNEKHNNNNINQIIDNGGQNQLTEDILFTFFDKFFGICCDNLNYLSMNKYSLRRETIFIHNFFNNLLIWGVQGGDAQFEDNFEFYPYKGRRILQEANDILVNFNSKEQINVSPIAKLMQDVSEGLQKIINVMDNLDIIYQENKNIKNENTNKSDIIININNNENNLKEKLISNLEENEINTNINTNKENNLINENKFYEKLNNIKGSIKLFKTFSGHNGLLRPDEREQFYTYLLTSGIIS